MGLGPSPGRSLAPTALPASWRSPGWRRGWGGGLGPPPRQVSQCRLVLRRWLLRASASPCPSGRECRGPLAWTFSLAGTVVPLASVSLGRLRAPTCAWAGLRAGDAAGQVLGPGGGRGGGRGCWEAGGGAGLGGAGRGGRQLCGPSPGGRCSCCSFVLNAPWVLEAWLGDRPAPRGPIHPAPSPSALTLAPRGLEPRPPPLLRLGRGQAVAREGPGCLQTGLRPQAEGRKQPGGE